MRVIASHRGNKPLLSSDIFHRFEHINSCAGSLNNVGQTEAHLWQAPIILVGQWLRDELRFIQKFPEPIRVTSKVMAYSGRTQAWVDADKEDSESRLNVVCEPLWE